MKKPVEDVHKFWNYQGEFFIRRTLTFTAVKFFTICFICLKIVYLPILSNFSNSNLNVLDITIGLINKLFDRNIYIIISYIIYLYTVIYKQIIYINI